MHSNVIVKKVTILKIFTLSMQLHSIKRYLLSLLKIIIIFKKSIKHLQRAARMGLCQRGMGSIRNACAFITATPPPSRNNSI